MRILLQRVSRAEVRIRPDDTSGAARVAGRIGPGYVVFVGFTHSDTQSEVRWLAEKIIGLRLFADEDDRLNRDLKQSGGALLIVSQFTLYADARKGRRPSFAKASPSSVAIPLYEHFLLVLRSSDLDVQTGEFGAKMDVELINDGPVTIWIEREFGELP